MTNDSFRRRALDEAIDRAVRDMMHLDPTPGLRRRVMSRLQRRSFASWLFAHRRAWLPLEAAAVVMILLAVILPRVGRTPPRVTQAPSAVSDAPAIASHSVSVPPATSAPAVAKPPRARGAPDPELRSESIFGMPRGRVSAATVDRTAAPLDDVTAPALDESAQPVAPIVMTPLSPVTEIRVAPIDVPRITVSALSQLR